MKQRKASPAGFSLIEVAMVIVVGGLVISAASSLLVNYLRELNVTTTQNRMQEIDNALVQYVSVNGVLPCPADLTEPQDTAKFGREVTDPVYAPVAPVDCYTSAGAPAGVFATTGVPPGIVTTNGTGYVVIGAVPVRTLNLPDQDIADGWSNRFVYAVTDALTTPFDYDPTQGSIIVQDGSGNDLAVPHGSAQYVIVSYGADGDGAYTMSGAQSTACPTSALETPNCTLSSSSITYTFVKTTVQPTANTYDDYVLFHASPVTTTKAPIGAMPSGAIFPFVQTTVCPAGWTNYTGNACTFGTGVICCQKF